MQKLLPWLTCLAFALFVAACGGGGGDGGPSATPAPASIATRVEAGPAAVLLTSLGASRALSWQLLDASGAPVSGAITWSSSDPAAVAVDSSGTVRALVGAGNAWITASSGSLPPVTVLVTIAQPVAGAQLLADSQIVAGPTPVDPNAAPSFRNPYEVVLRGMPALAVGNLVIASESANVAGRVLSVQPEGAADQRVRLVPVPPKELFTDFAFRDTVDLGSLGLVIPPEITERYDVVQNGRTYVFTPKPGVSRERERPTALGEAPPPPPFTKCETVPNTENGRPLPLSVSVPPTFEAFVEGTLGREVTSAGGTRITLTGQPKFKLNSVIEVRAAFEGKVTCKLTFGRTPTLRAPGWASFIGGEVEFGLGFELGGKLTAASPKLGAAMKFEGALNAVLECPPTTSVACSFTGTATGQPSFEPQFTAPALEQAQAEAALSLFGFASLEIGSADVQALQLSAIEVKMGPEFSVALTPEALQIANLDADTGRSKYALAFKGEVGPGVKLGEVLAFLGLSEVVPLKIGFSADLGASPKSTSVVADRARYLPGERANVVVKLDAASTRFPQGLLYNVERIELRRKSGLFGTEVLAQQDAVDPQTEFTLAFDSPGLIDVGEIFAFVFTKALSPVPVSYELAAATVAAPAGDQVSHNGLEIRRRSDIAITEADGTLTEIAPFDDSLGVRDESSSPPFVGTLSSTKSLPGGMNVGGSMTLSATSDIDSVDRDLQSGRVRVITMKGGAACDFALSDSDGQRRFQSLTLNGEYRAGRGVLIGAGGATVSISANISVSRQFEFGTSRASARIGVGNENTFEEFEIRDTNVEIQPVATTFNRTFVVPAGSAAFVDLDAVASCQTDDRRVRLTQSHAAEATFTITVVRP